jgi:hypothetical protein
VEHTGYLIAVEAGLLLGLLVAAVWTLYFHIPRRTRRLFKRAARLVGGRLDPASESARFPAVLVELEGQLIRAVLWPLDVDEDQVARPPYLDVCTPVDGISAPVSAVRTAEGSRLLPLLSQRRAEVWAETERAGDVTISSPKSSVWAAEAVAAHPTWAALELDRGRLRVLTNHPQFETFDANAVAGAILEFARSLPDVGKAAGLPTRARVDGPHHGPAIH